MTDPKPAAMIAIAVLGAAHGVRGEVRLKSFTQNPADFAKYGALADAAGSRRFAIRSARAVRDDLFIVKLEAIDSRAAAEALNGVALYVPRSALPPPGADEFYHADLIGLLARGENGEPMGRIRAVLNFGAGDILAIDRDGGGELLAPFTKETAPRIDFAAGFLILRPPTEIVARKEDG